MKKGYSRRSVFILFALYVVFYLIQGVIHEKYLFSIVAGIILIYLWNKMGKPIIQMPNKDDVGRNMLGHEIETYVSTGAILWCFYTFFPTFNHIEYLTHVASVGMWLVLLLVAYFIIGKIAYNPWWILHLRLVASVLLILLATDKSLEYYNLFFNGALSIVLLSYIISMKRILFREDLTLGVDFGGISKTTFICLAVFSLSCGFGGATLVRMFLYQPLTIGINWIFVILMAVAACFKIADAEESWLLSNQGCQMMTIVFYLVMVKMNLLPFSLLGILMACFVMDWIATWLYKWKYINHWSGIVFAYIAMLPLAYIIWDSFGKNRVEMLLVLLICLCIILVVKKWDKHRKNRRAWMFLVFLPCFILVATKYGLFSFKAFILLLGTALVVWSYIHVTDLFIWGRFSATGFTKEYWKTASSHSKARKILCYIVILIPLLIAVVNLRKDDTYLDVQLTGNSQVMAIGNNINVQIKGEEFSNVVFEWETGETEQFESSSNIETTVKSNRLVVNATDSEGKEHKYTKYFFVFKYPKE